MMRFLFWATFCCAALNFLLLIAVPTPVVAMNFAATLVSFATVWMNTR